MTGAGTSSALEVPPKGESDRKRVLNVLAQRRYRQRKRERITALEQKTKSIARSSSASSPQDTPSSFTDAPAAAGGEITPQECYANPRSYPINNISSTDSIDDEPTAQPNSLGTASDPRAFLDMPVLNLGNFISDTAPFIEPLDFTSELQELESSQFSFTDETFLDVPLLNVMKAASSMATLLGCTDTLWDLNFRGTLSPSSISHNLLLPNLEPTRVQQIIPHPSLFDLLPWSSVRDKLITVFSMPAVARPAIARDSMALMQLVFDLDDSAEGLRVSGFDWRDEANWEVGQTVLNNWWFVLDRDIIERSNLLRRNRGASRLIAPASQNSAT